MRKVDTQQVLDDYSKIKNYDKVAVLHNVSPGVIKRLLNSRGIQLQDCYKKRYDWDYILQEYTKGRTIKSIALELGTFNTSIRRYFLRHGIIPRDSSEATAVVKLPIFSNLTEEAQYWLGFIMADGNISTINNAIAVTTAEKDLEHLKKYAAFVGVKVMSVYNKRFDLTEYRVQFANKRIKEWMISIGITPKKSHTLKLTIPLTTHMFRGVLDGDGYVSKKGLIEIATASPHFRLQLLNFLADRGIHTTDSIYPAKNQSLLFMIRVSTRSECLKLYNLLYKDASIFLERKKNRLCPKPAKTGVCNIVKVGETWHGNTELSLS